MMWCRAAGDGMCGRSSVNLSILKQREEMLGIFISPVYSSTLMHQVLRSIFRRRRKCIGSISYSSDQSTLSRLYMALWIIRDRRSSTRGCVSEQCVANRMVRPSAAASDVI